MFIIFVIMFIVLFSLVF